MKKCVWILAAALTLCLLAGTAMAAEMPDPDFYFNAGAEKQTSGANVVYDYAFEADPRAAVEAYVALLTDSYGFALTDSYLEPELAQWRLENAAEKISVAYDQGSGGYCVSLRVSKSVSCQSAEAWDWAKNAIADSESNDISVLPDFLKHDSSGKYFYRGSGFSFRADSTSSACVRTVEDYVALLLARGYTLVDDEEEHKSGWDMHKWYLHSGLSGLGKVESGVNAHVMVRINVYHDNGYCAVSFTLVDGITMPGYGGGTPDDDLFEKDCWWCGYDGRCDDCGGSGEVRKNVPGTREYIMQNCTNCNNGECKHCGGDGNAPD